MYKNKNKSILLALILSTITPIAMLSVSQTVSANVLPSASALDLIKSTCPAGANQYQELTQLKDKIAKADSVSQARTLALSPTDDAINALKNARTLVPFSDDLRTAETHLSDARNRILMAASQKQVADEFDGIMLAGLDNDSIANVKVGSGSCSYSTGETIAIVIGLILGIIPGLILLVLLC